MSTNRSVHSPQARGEYQVHSPQDYPCPEFHREECYGSMRLPIFPLDSTPGCIYFLIIFDQVMHQRRRAGTITHDRPVEKDMSPPMRNPRPKLGVLAYRNFR